MPPGRLIAAGISNHDTETQPSTGTTNRFRESFAYPVGNPANTTNERNTVRWYRYRSVRIMTKGKNTTAMDSLPKRLRAARAVAGLSLNDLAAQVGVDRHRLSRWERSVDPIPPLVEPGLIAAVSDATGFPAEFFTDGKETR